MAGLSLWLLRHATVPGAQGLCHGRTDLPADPEATRAAARRLAGAVPPAPVWTSPLQRCLALATALRDTGAPLDWQGTDARLAEMDFGTWEGRPWSGITPADFAPWMTDFAHHRVGGGDSVTHFMARVSQALDHTRGHCRHHGHAHAVWVSHAGVARALALLVQGRGAPAQARDWPREAPACGEWVCFSVPPASGAGRPG